MSQNFTQSTRTQIAGSLPRVRRRTPSATTRASAITLRKPSAVPSRADTTEQTELSSMAKLAPHLGIPSESFTRDFKSQGQYNPIRVDTMIRQTTNTHLFGPGSTFESGALAACKIADSAKDLEALENDPLGADGPELQEPAPKPQLIDLIAISQSISEGAESKTDKKHVPSVLLVMDLMALIMPNPHYTVPQETRIEAFKILQSTLKTSAGIMETLSDPNAFQEMFNCKVREAEVAEALAQNFGSPNGTRSEYDTEKGKGFTELRSIISSASKKLESVNLEVLNDPSQSEKLTQLLNNNVSPIVQQINKAGWTPGLDALGTSFQIAIDEVRFTKQLEQLGPDWSRKRDRSHASSHPKLSSYHQSSKKLGTQERAIMTTRSRSGEFVTRTSVPAQIQFATRAACMQNIWSQVAPIQARRTCKKAYQDMAKLGEQAQNTRTLAFSETLHAISHDPKGNTPANQTNKALLLALIENACRREAMTQGSGIGLRHVLTDVDQTATCTPSAIASTVTSVTQSRKYNQVAKSRTTAIAPRNPIASLSFRLAASYEAKNPALGKPQALNEMCRWGKSTSGSISAETPALDAYTPGAYDERPQTISDGPLPDLGTTAEPLGNSALNVHGLLDQVQNNLETEYSQISNSRFGTELNECVVGSQSQNSQIQSPESRLTATQKQPEKEKGKNQQGYLEKHNERENIPQNKGGEVQI